MGSNSSGGLSNKLTPAMRDSLRGLILAERLSNRAIVERLEKENGVSVTSQAISYYRRQYLPELQSSDLEAIQAGAATFVARAASLSSAAAALLDSAVDDTGRLKKTRGAAFSLSVLAQVLDQLQRLAQGAEDRVWKREKIEIEREKVAIERSRLEIERRRDEREAEKWQMEKELARREMLIFDEREEASRGSLVAVGLPDALEGG